jgi:hypothetical protein
MDAAMLTSGTRLSAIDSPQRGAELSTASTASAETRSVALGPPRKLTCA